MVHSNYKRTDPTGRIVVGKDKQQQQQQVEANTIMPCPTSPTANSSHYSLSYHHQNDYSFGSAVRNPFDNDDNKGKDKTKQTIMGSKKQQGTSSSTPSSQEPPFKRSKGGTAALYDVETPPPKANDDTTIKPTDLEKDLLEELKKDHRPSILSSASSSSPTAAAAAAIVDCCCPFGNPLEPEGNKSFSSSNTTTTTVSMKQLTFCQRKSCLLSIWIVIIGGLISAAFIALGVRGAKNDQQLRLQQQASDIVQAIQSTWDDYTLASMWIHNTCRPSTTKRTDATITTSTNTTSLPFSICTREEFHALYEYLVADRLEFEAIIFVPNITHDYRMEFEDEAQWYFAENYPYINYTGFTSLQKDDHAAWGGYSIQPQSEKPFYFPQHFVEPIPGNEYMLDFDIYSPEMFFLVDRAVTSWNPILSPPLPIPHPDKGNYIFMLHPGVKLTSEANIPNIVSKGLSTIVVSFESILQRSARPQDTHTHTYPVSVYIFDVTNGKEGKESYFGGIQHWNQHNDVGFGRFHYNHDDDDDKHHQFQQRMKGENQTNGDYILAQPDKLKLGDLTRQLHKSSTSSVIVNEIEVEHQIWSILVQAEEGAFHPDDIKYVIVGGILIWIACCCVALWLDANVRRMMYIEEIKTTAETERAALIVQNAQETAHNERQLNEYLAHEVRNPLSAAMSACSFLSFAHQDLEQKPILPGNEKHETVQGDINIIKSSLHFINDLLRSMLDMQKAANKQVKLIETPTDILKDILEPVRTILYRQDSSTCQIEIDCPEQLIVMVDRLRLKQVILNLASNSKKFVQTGYIRLGARLVTTNEIKKDGGNPSQNLQLFVEDSGPGIPLEKRCKLFSRFQESLDSLNQGTGMGLSLCESLVRLMQGDIVLDESFHSGIENCPGTRFVITLHRTNPVRLESIDLDNYESMSEQFNDSFGGAPKRTKSQETSTTTTSLSQDRDKQLPPLSPKGPSVSSRKDPQDTTNQPGTTTTSNANVSTRSTGTLSTCSTKELPEVLTVLVVDDDMVLRKLLSRSIKRVAPQWTIHEAANGETAIEMATTTTTKYDLIFLDQYMASAEKQLLGSETATALRSKGVTSRICGLSANNLGDTFRNAGADWFLLKPFRCERDALIEDLLNVLDG